MGVFLLKVISATKLKKSAFSLFNLNFIESEISDRTSFFDAFKSVIFVFSLLVFSLLTYRFKNYKLDLVLEDFTSFLSVLLILSSYFLIKRVLEYLFTHLFLIKNEVHLFIISKNSYLYSISILLYIAIVLSEYANLEQVVLFYFSAFLFVLRFVFHVIVNKNLIFSKLFYFILYFCAFEIAPLFILFKLMF